MVTPEEETELVIEMFSVLVEQEKAQDGSRNPNYSHREKNRLDAESEKLKAKFQRLAKKAEGETEIRKISKGAVYALAELYLDKYYPAGSLTVDSGDIPSLFKFARLIERDGGLTDTTYGELEIESVDGKNTIHMGIHGDCIKPYSRDQLKTGYTRARKDIKDQK